MDKELSASLRQLQQQPESLVARQHYTRNVIRANHGTLLVWRGGVGAPPDADFIEIEQPLFPQSEVIELTMPDYAANTKHNPLIKQQFQCFGVANLDDLTSLLHLQPSGALTLPDAKYSPFHSHIKDMEVITGRYPIEKYYQPIYSTARVHTAGTAQLNFFQRALGSEFLGTYYTQLQTNMDQAGSLPYPKNFKIFGISIILDPTTPHEDAVKFISNAWFRLFIGTMDYLVLPANLASLVPGNTNPVIRMQHSSPLEPVLNLPQEIDLISQQNFRVEVNFPIPQQYSKSFDVQAVLHGYFYRERRERRSEGYLGPDADNG